MKLTVKKWGNSLALRLPRELAQQIACHEGAKLDVSLTKDSLVLTPDKTFTITDFMQGLSRESRHEPDPITPLGREIL